jgi:hypothetical protein
MIRKLLYIVFVVSAVVLHAQTIGTNPNPPHLIRYGGKILSGSSSEGVLGITFSLYKDQEGGVSLWHEVQNVQLDAAGNYTVELGAISDGGVPIEHFASGEARWLGVQVGTDPEMPRVLLVSVPYALKAGDAETLGGKPLTAFVLNDSESAGTSQIASPKTKTTGASSSNAGTSETNAPIGSNPVFTTAATQNYVPKWLSDGQTLSGTSLLYDSGTAVGIGTSTPAFPLTVQGQGAFQIAAVGPAGGNVISSFVQGTTKRASLFINQAGAAVMEGYQDGVGPLNFAIGPAGGNVGIGTSTPAYPLTVAGQGAFQIAAVGPAGGNVISSFVQGTTKRASLFINQAGAAVMEGFQDGVGPLNFAIGPAGGNVGIGTSTPAYPLTVQGQGAFQIAAVGPAGGNVISSFVQGTTKRASLFINQAGTAVIEGFQDGVGPLNFSINPAAGNVGIGTSTPQNRLSVAGTVESTSGGFKFPDGSLLTSATNPTTPTIYTASTSTQVVKAVQNQAGGGSFLVTGIPSGLRGDATSTGNVAGVFGSAVSEFGYGVAGVNLGSCPDRNDKNCNGVGVLGMAANQSQRGTAVFGDARSTIGDNVGVYGHSLSDSGTGVQGFVESTSGDGVGVYGETLATSGTGVYGIADHTTGDTVGLYGQILSPNGIGVRLDVPTGANILVGRAANTKVVRIDSAGKGWFNGGTQTGGADFAESVDVIGGASKYQPGDVLMVDEGGERRFALANEPYSTKIAGIYSTKPGVLATPHADGDPRLNNEVPLAIVGIVPCKVSAENGAIKPGDLLVASSHPGYAMKGTDRQKMFGAVVGKALGTLDKDTGVIEVLVSLH